jgi:aerobic carbon-monoxide dehydrogenase medium subunit
VILGQFDYVAPTTVAGAVAALREPGSVAIAGGHHLLTRLKRRELEVRQLVDLGALPELRGVTSGPAGLRVGALTTLTQLLQEPAAGAYGAITDALSALGDQQSRNRVTVGGQLACGRVGNDLAAALMVHGAVVHLTGPAGARTVPLTELWGTGSHLDTAPGELIMHVQLEPPVASGYARMTNRATLEAVVGVAAAVVVAAGRAVGSCRIAAVGAMVRPGRIPTMEESITHSSGRNGLVAPPVDTPFVDDHLAGADYRRHMTGELAGTALALAASRTS